MAHRDVVPANPGMLDEMEDLTRLSFLNEPSILHNLLRRFQADSIYTAAGSVLVAINPFRPVILLVKLLMALNESCRHS